MSQSTETNPSGDPQDPRGRPAEAAIEEDLERPAAGEIAEAKKEAAESHERYLRAVADLENYRKRTVREKDELRQYAAASILEDLLPIMDNLALGLAAARQQSDGKAIVDGVEMVMNQMKSALAKHGLAEINPAGQKFDPNLHECISQQPGKGVPEGVVLQVTRPGYSLNGRLLRPASVVVSTGRD